MCLLQPAAGLDQERINRRDGGVGGCGGGKLISMIHCFVLPSVCHKLCRAGWERLCEGRDFEMAEGKKTDIQQNQGLADKS